MSLEERKALRTEQIGRQVRLSKGRDRKQMAQSRAQQGHVGLYLGPHLIGTAGPGTKVGWGHADVPGSQKMRGQLRWGGSRECPP